MQTHAFEVIRFDSARLDFGLLLCAMEKFSAANMNIISELIFIGISFAFRANRATWIFNLCSVSIGLRALRISRLISSTLLHLRSRKLCFANCLLATSTAETFEFEVQKAIDHQSEYLPINNCSAVSVAGNKKSLTSSDGVDGLRYPNAQRSSNRFTKSRTKII